MQDFNYDLLDLDPERDELVEKWQQDVAFDEMMKPAFRWTFGIIFLLWVLTIFWHGLPGAVIGGVVLAFPTVTVLFAQVALKVSIYNSDKDIEKHDKQKNFDLVSKETDFDDSHL